MAVPDQQGTLAGIVMPAGKPVCSDMDMSWHCLHRRKQRAGTETLRLSQSASHRYAVDTGFPAGMTKFLSGKPT
jgi:hypothetical protein